MSPIRQSLIIAMPSFALIFNQNDQMIMRQKFQNFWKVCNYPTPCYQPTLPKFLSANAITQNQNPIRLVNRTLAKFLFHIHKHPTTSKKPTKDNIYICIENHPNPKINKITVQTISDNQPPTFKVFQKPWRFGIKQIPHKRNTAQLCGQKSAQKPKIKVQQKQLFSAC